MEADLSASTAAESIILIVEDDQDSQDLLAQLLKNDGYHLIFASEGVTALDLASRHQPDLILLDVMLPDLDGFEICRRLRANPDLSEVPIVFVTALHDRASRLRALNTGADDIIPKPFDLLELKARIQTIIRLNRYRRILQERERFERLALLAPYGLAIVDAGLQIVLDNPEMLRMTAATEPTLMGRPLETLVEARHRTRLSEAIASVLRGASPRSRIEISLVASNQTLHPVEANIGACTWDGRPAVQIIFRDITDRKRADLLELQQRSLAYDIHDGAAQLAVHLHQILQVYAHHYRPRSSPGRESLDRAMGVAQQLIVGLRTVIAGLRPTVLDDFGLATALRILADQLRSDGWAASAVSNCEGRRFTPAVETAAYRIAEEAIANIRRHTRPCRVSIDAHAHDDWLTLTVRDEGAGFDPYAPILTPRQGGVGLHGMRERAAILGGRCTIESQPGAGTVIVAELPLAEQTEL